ncbi:MAG: transposase [Methanomassiliicoccaceae archaeon]|nr:transposase [Methanomassiliicoccaceae archaeon]
MRADSPHPWSAQQAANNCQILKFSKGSAELLSKSGFKYSKARVPAEGLRYAQVRKTLVDGRLVEVERRTIFGKVDKKDITTSIVERLNLTFRQELNRLSRKTIGASKCISHLTAHFSFYARYYNFCRPHRSHPLGGIRYGTPAMAVGATDEVWSIRKLLFFPYWNYINQS